VRNWSGLWAPGTGWLMGGFFSRAPNALVLHAAYHGRPGGSAPLLLAAASAARGVEFAPESGSGGLVHVSPVDAQEEWELPVFPRRAGSVSVRAYQHIPGDRWVRVAEFVVPNPVPGPYPVWKPQPLPIARRAGDLVVTLTSLAAGATKNPLNHLPPGDHAWTRAAFRIEQNDRATTVWKPIAVTMSDATGNRWVHRLPGSGSDLLFGGTLPATEAAWKLRVEFSQIAQFTPGELWNLAGVPVPRRDQLIDPVATIRRQGAALRLSLTGAGDPFGRGRMWRQPFRTISVTVSPPSPGLQLTLLHAADDRGRRITAFGGLPSSLGGGKYRFLVDRMPPGARTMNLLFAMHKNRFVEFLVAPPGS